jgi:hypothetical protein
MNIDNALRERLRDIYIQKAMMEGQSTGLGMIGGIQKGHKMSTASKLKMAKTRRKNMLLKKRCALEGMGYSVGGIAKGQHMTASAKRKAKITRARNFKLACAKFDNKKVKNVRSKRHLENHMERSESAKIASKHNPWIQTVKRVAKENKGLNLAEIMHLAQQEYYGK